MEMFLAFIKDTCLLVSANLLPITLVVIVVAVIIWAVVAMIYESKVARLRDTAAEEIQARTEISGQLDNAQQQAQQLQTELNSQHERIAQLEKEKQQETERAATLTEQAEQQTKNLADNTVRIDSAMQRVEQLQTEANHQNNRIAQLEKDKQGEIDRSVALTQQVEQHTKYLTDSIQVLAAFLDEPVPDETSDSATLWQQHEDMAARVFSHSLSDNNTQEQLQQATTQLTEQAAVIEHLQQALATQTEHNTHLARELEQQQTSAIETQAALSAAKQQLQQAEAQLQQQTAQLEQLEKANQTTQTQLKQQTGQIDSKQQQAEQSLAIALREKEALIKNLTATIEGHENHIARLQERLSGKTPPQEETPIATAQKQTDVVKPVEISPATATKPLAALGDITAMAEQELQQLTEKFKQMPTQLQGLYNKVLTGFKK